MKYFIDTEFLEGTQTKKVFGIPIGQGWKILDKPYQQTKPTIDLISIGIVAEDGREYYAISKDFNLEEAWNRYEIKKVINTDAPLSLYPGKIDKKVYWIRENVLFPIYNDIVDLGNREKDEYFTFENFKKLINKYGKTNKQIAEEVHKFIALTSCDCDRNEDDLKICKKHNIEFYGYYSAYDWVVFCWLFGKMIDLPKGFPMYCIDLKQMIDSKEWNYRGIKYNHDGLKRVPDYPKEIDKHNALSDAHWNKQLYEFLNKL